MKEKLSHLTFDLGANACAPHQLAPLQIFDWGDNFIFPRDSQLNFHSVTLSVRASSPRERGGIVAKSFRKPTHTHTNRVSWQFSEWKFVSPGKVFFPEKSSFHEWWERAQEQSIYRKSGLKKKMWLFSHRPPSALHVCHIFNFSRFVPSRSETNWIIYRWLSLCPFSPPTPFSHSGTNFSSTPDWNILASLFNIFFFAAHFYHFGSTNRKYRERERESHKHKQRRR